MNNITDFEISPDNQDLRDRRQRLRNLNQPVDELLNKDITFDEKETLRNLKSLYENIVIYNFA